MKRSLRILRLLAIAAGVWIIIAVVFALSVQNAIVFPRDFAAAQGPLGAPPPGFEQVWITSVGDQPGKRVEAWFLPGEGRTAESPGPAVMIFHGNAMLIDYCVEWAEAWRRRGCSALVCEFRGYGRSEGDPTQARIHSDMLQFRAWLDARPEVDAQRVVYHGRSLGGAVAAALGAERPPAAMVLECTFTSMSAMFWRSFVPGFLATNPYRTIRTLPKFDGPTLILHGEWDEIVPVSHARRLHDAAATSELHILPGGHNDFPVDRAAAAGIVDAFVRKHGLWGGEK